MNSQSFISASQKKYYIELGKEDYYTGHNDPRGRFMGSGAKELHLNDHKIGQNDKAFSNLMDGKSPDGETVMRKSGGTIRYRRDKTTGKVEKQFNPRCAIDNVFSAPKDVSVLWATAPKEIREQIFKIHQEAVEKSVEYLDSICFTRTNKRNPDHSRTLEFHKANGIFAAFDHTTSRELDPQLHTHVLLLNAATREDGQGHGAIDGKKILQGRYVAGMIYQNHVRNELERQLKVATYDRPFSDEKGTSFGIKGISSDVKDRFSKRSMQIMEQIDSGMTGAQVRAVVLKTRKKKTCPDPNILQEEWSERAKAMGFDINQVLGRQVDPKNKSIKERVVAKASQVLDTHLKKFDSTLSEKEELLCRDVANTIRRKVEYRQNQLYEKAQKKAEKQIRQDTFVRGKVESGTNKKDAERLYKRLYKPTKIEISEREKRAEEFTKNSIVTAFMQQDKSLEFEKAQQLTEQFIKRFTNRIEREKPQQEGTQYTQHYAEKNVSFTLNYEGVKFSRVRTTREQLVDSMNSVIKWRKDLKYELRDVTFRKRQRAFNFKVKSLYATGRISRKKYLQITEKKYLQYSEFKLAVLQTFGVLSAKQVRHARKSKKYEVSPYAFVAELYRDGRVTREEAQALRLKVFKEKEQSQRVAQKERDRANIEAFQQGRWNDVDRGRER